jgi:hypothetical protein
MRYRLKTLEKKLRAGRCPACDDGGERDELTIELLPVGAAAPKSEKPRTCEVCGRVLDEVLDLRPPAE